MSTADPKTVTIEQVRAAYRLLGLDPAAWDATAQVTITRHTIIAIRAPRTTGGRRFMTDAGPVTEVVVVEVDRG